ncbi:hypothetical protein EB796_009329 [Bugula neritina]|uniref:Cyclic nucleotide-binding domain-containing protein n=1 Tax=Bugula neritina TaxID=10212 RepID=A0A7J7K448_BUGNE|nr:hypothetical protein EB796_009329 [Bugula neritina]
MPLCLKLNDKAYGLDATPKTACSAYSEKSIPDVSMSSATKNIDKKRQSATSTENRSSLRSVTNGQRSEGIASSRTSHGSVAGQESLFPLQLTRLHKHKSSITRKISHRRLPASSDLQQQECSAGSSRFQNSIQVKELFRKVVRRAVICLHWLSEVFYHIRRENFLEHQLIQIFDKSKGAEHTLSLKQLELAGTVFNKHNYKARNQSFLNKEIEYILTTPSHTRTAEELSLVLNSLQSVKSFSEFPTHVQQLLCQVSWFQRVPPRKVIIRQGQKGLNFYFVISGSGVVKVLRRRTDDTIMNKQLVVARVHPGSSFGDIALLHNVERTATVESVTEMCLLVVGREDYKKIFLQRGILQEHLNFLKSVNSLKHWPVEKLNESRSDCIFHYFRRGKVIVADSNNSDFLYVVKSGSCEVIKDIPDISTYANRKRLKAQVKENVKLLNQKSNSSFDLYQS